MESGASSRFVNEFVGMEVTVWYRDSSGTKDNGILDGFDGYLIRLRRDNNGRSEILLVPIEAVRLLKPTIRD